MGKSSDLNIGNGKSVSAVGKLIDKWLEDDDKTIISNIKLKGIDYIEFHPEDIDDVLKTDNALVLLDELHAIVHKNHRISESCQKHTIKGLCYRISEFLRQVRKRDIDTASTCQTFGDAHYQYRTLMQEQIVCSKYHLSGSRLYKCDSDTCPPDHTHYIKQDLYRNYTYIKELPLFNPTPYYDFYDSYEIVEGWVQYD